MRQLRRSLRSSPKQTFVFVPLAVLALELLRGTRPRLTPGWLALMAAGYALYRATGSYRSGIAGGHGFDSVPRALVTEGPYALTRNPMYLGHLVFLFGLVGATRSPLALALFLRQLMRFRDRVALDEQRLERLFGEEYRAYRARVPRWI